MAEANEFKLYVVSDGREERSAPTEKLTMPWRKGVEVNEAKFKETFEDLLKAIRYMCGKASTAMEGYVIDEITVSLGVSAEGGLAFVAKAGIKGDIELKISRPTAK